MIFYSSFFVLFAIAVETLKQVCFKNACIRVEIADTYEKRKAGLMFRESLPENQGMLFIFDSEDYYSFWMKNMRIPLDIIWIDKDKRIVDIKADVPPCKDSCEGLPSNAKAKYILEVNVGFAERNGIKIGDEVRF
jgi:uncharacterized membrane protein (UPF0127 family)